jgi:hypothetical protein
MSYTKSSIPGLVGIVMIAILIASCKQKKYTPEHLEKAIWDSLSPGLYHISTKSGTVLATDAIEINFPDTSFKNVPLEIRNDLLTLVLEKVKKTLHNSRSGYLKVNFPDMLKPDTIKAMLYLTGDDVILYRSSRIRLPCCTFRVSGKFTTCQRK